MSKLPVFFLLAFSLTLLSCSHEYHCSNQDTSSYQKRKGEPSYTITIGHSECTECMDGYIYEGTVKVPLDLRKTLGDTLTTKDVILVGNFPFDLIDPGNLFFTSKTRFKITGKIIGPNPKYSTGAIPVFYVEQWERMK